MSLVVSGSNGVTEPGIITIGTSSGLWLSFWANLDTLASGDDTAIEIYDPTSPTGLIIGIQDDFGGAPGTFMFRVVGETSGSSGFFNVGFDIVDDPTSGWHHAFLFIPFGAGTSQTSIRAWWDGTEATVTDYSGGGTYTGGISSATLNIGYGLDSTTGVDGNLAEVGIWSSATAPSSLEISDLSDGTGATRPGDLSTSATLVAYAPLETGYALDTPSGTLTDIGTGSTSIASGTHPTMASAGTTITSVGTAAETSSVVVNLARATQGTGTAAETSSVGADLARATQATDTAAETSSVTVELGRATQGAGTAAETSSATAELARATQGTGTATETSSAAVDFGRATQGTGTATETSSAAVELQQAHISAGTAAETSSVVVDLRTEGGTITSVGTAAETSSVVVGLARSVSAQGTAAETSSVVVDLARATQATGAAAETSSVAVALQQAHISAGTAAETSSVVINLVAQDPTARAIPRVSAARYRTHSLTARRPRAGGRL